MALVSHRIVLRRTLDCNEKTIGELQEEVGCPKRCEPTEQAVADKVYIQRTQHDEQVRFKGSSKCESI